MQYVELDFADVVTKKIKTINANSLLKDLLVTGQSNTDNSDDRIISKHYRLLSGDVRET